MEGGEESESDASSSEEELRETELEPRAVKRREYFMYLEISLFVYEIKTNAKCVILLAL